MEVNTTLLCGSVPFWDLDYSWNTDLPLFTRCFRRSVFGCLFYALFLFLTPLHLWKLNRKTCQTSSKLSVLTCLKIFFSGILTVIALMDLFYWSLDDNVLGIDVIEATGRALTFITFTSITISEMKQGARTSGFQFISWSIYMLFQMITFYSEIIDFVHHDYSANMFPVVTNGLTTSFTFASLICHFFADLRPDYKVPSCQETSSNESPILDASYPSNLFLSWFTSFAWLGFKRPLGFDDLMDLPPFLQSSTIVPKFLKTLNMCLPKVVQIEQSNGVEMSEKAKDLEGCSQQGHIIRTILKAYGSQIATAALLKLLPDIFIFYTPILLKNIIGYAQSDEQLWKGILYSLGLLFLTSLKSILETKTSYEMYLIGIRMKSSLTSLIYRKSLRISPQGKADSTSGEIVNLMSVDVQAIANMMPILNLGWSAPVQIGIALIMLYQTLGASIFAGFLVMILMIPINGLVVGLTRKFQMKQMKQKDKRVKQMNEIIQGIKIIKLYGWEQSCQKRVADIRDKEINILRNMSYMSCVNSFVWTCAPFVVSLVTFATYVFMDENNVLDSQKAFVSLALFNIMKIPLTFLPHMILATVQGSVSTKRINKFLNRDEILPKKSKKEKNLEGSSVSIKNGAFSWTKKDDHEEPFLTNIDLEIKKKSLVAIVGPVGSGKSSLISAILGEMEKSSGKVELDGSIGYCSQQPWIQNASLKNNILFHKNFDKDFYDKVVESCALGADLKTLPGGDETEIGEKGINLSGGQKHRVALSRLVYSEADICILDDPLSAVDASVGQHIFTKVIGPDGLLSDKTRILVTHAINFLPQVDQIIVMKEGQIAERGTYQELLDKKGPFSEFLSQHSRTTESTESEQVNDASNDEDSKLARTDQEKPSIIEKQYKVEKMETGKVNWRVYTYYISNMGLILFSSCLLGFTMFQLCSTGSFIWLAVWSDQENLRNSTNHETLQSLGIYGLLGVGQTVTVCIATVLLFLSTLQGAKTLHNNMLANILSSPMSFFDTTPQGRIINRFGKDIDVLDSGMAFIFQHWITCFMGVLAAFLVIAWTTPLFLLPVAVIMTGYVTVQRIYVASSRQLKRLESVSKSPVYSHFGETLNGLATIRAFCSQGESILQNENLVDANQKAYHPSIVANRWLGLRLEMAGNLIIFCSSLFAVLGKDDLTPGLVGLSVSYAMSVTQILNWMVRMQSELETNIVAVERVKEYTETQQEAKWTLPTDEKLDKCWPLNACIEFKNVHARYREGLPLILKDLSFIIEGQQRVGIVGRTGAGKTSVTLTLFRIMELDQGNILIDGIDTTSIGLQTLRTKMTIIPQDPVLFSGSLRLNLDPFDQYSDQELHQALKLAHLESFVTNLKEGLEHEITEGGENVSLGQRQLICLAR